jgi:hypothetical protein
MGGTGKTAIAMALCHQYQVRNAFPDGIVWLPIGPQPKATFDELAEVIARSLGVSLDHYGTGEYRSILESRAVLLVLDDVWSVEDVEPFRLGSGRSRLLYTSRDKALAGPLGAESETVSLLDNEKSRQLLLRWAAREQEPPPEAFVSNILEQCQGLALGLAMIGASLRGQPDSEWKNVVEDLRQSRLKELGAPHPGGYPYQTLYAALEVSVDALPASIKDLYLKLAALQEDTSASIEQLRTLWGVDDNEIKRTIRLLANLSLVHRDAEGIRLHPLQLDFLRGERVSPEPSPQQAAKSPRRISSRR